MDENLLKIHMGLREKRKRRLLAKKKKKSVLWGDAKFENV